VKILVAGIGNIFLGDDAFGVEVANRLMSQPQPQGVTVGDYGICSYDLAYAIMDGCDAAILIDAVQRGEPPGTLYLMELDPDAADQLDAGSVNAHAMNPMVVLQMVKSLGGKPGRLYLVGCETGTLEPEEGSLGLSDSVAAAAPKAVEMVQNLVSDLLNNYEITQTQLLRK